MRIPHFPHDGIYAVNDWIGDANERSTHNAISFFVRGTT